jgi:hypothetical protein
VPQGLESRDQSSQRIAALADATAAPRLRAALDAAARDDDAKLRDALAALEAAELDEGASERRRPHRSV